METTNPTLALIGLGGSGSWAAAVLAKSPKQKLNLVLCDADRWDESNVPRCQMNRLDVGRLKVDTARRLLSASGWESIKTVPRYLAPGTDDWKFLLGLPGQLRIMSLVDNHAGRRACLRLADLRAEQGAMDDVVVLAGNEYEAASADVYLPAWRGTKLDPRVRYPDIETGTEGDPLAPPCSGPAVESAPQLAEANSVAALTALWLMRVWAEREPARRGSEFHGAIVDRMPVSIQYGSVAAKILTKKEVEDAPQEKNRV